MKKNPSFLLMEMVFQMTKIKELLKFHKKKNKVATLTAVKPPARFGELFLKNNCVKNFEEKNQIN